MRSFPLFLCILTIAVIYSRYEAFDPRDASSSAVGAKEFADIYNFQKIKKNERANIRDLSGKLTYYIPPPSLFFYSFLLLLLFLVACIHLLFSITHIDMIVIYSSIVLLFIIYFLYDYFYRSRNGMYIVV